jgi:hypothetical protein
MKLIEKAPSQNREGSEQDRSPGEPVEAPCGPFGRSNEPQEHLFERLAAGRRGAQRRGLTLRDETPLVDDADVVAQALDDLEDVRRERRRSRRASRIRATGP